MFYTNCTFLILTQIFRTTFKEISANIFIYDNEPATFDSLKN